MDQIDLPDEATGSAAGPPEADDQPSPATPPELLEQLAPPWPLGSGLRIARSDQPVAAEPAPAPVEQRGAEESTASSGDGAAMSATAPVPPELEREAPAEERGGDWEMRDVPLGTLVYNAGLLTAEQVEDALNESVQRGSRLGEILLERGLLDDHDLCRLLAGQKGLEFVDLDAHAIDPDAVGLLTEDSARLYSALPIGVEEGVPVVAVSDPTNDVVVESVRRSIGPDTRFVVAARSDLALAISQAYSSLQGGEKPPAAESSELDTEAHVDQHVRAPEVHAVPSAEPDLPEASLVGAAPGVAAPELSPRGRPGEGEQPEGHEPQHAPPRTQPPLSQRADAVRTAESLFRVVLRLSDEERIEIGSHSDSASAAEHARDVIRSIDGTPRGEWPFYGGRFLRPDRVVSVDILEERQRFFE